MSGPNVWGPYGWKFIHYVTLGYPNNPSNEDKLKYLNFFNALQYVLPCSICSKHFQDHIKQYPLTDDILSDKRKFINWGIFMHNLVNVSNNKKVYSMEDGYEEIIKNNKEDERTHIHIEKANYYLYFLYTVILILILIIILTYIKK